MWSVERRGQHVRRQIVDLKGHLVPVVGVGATLRSGDGGVVDQQIQRRQLRGDLATQVRHLGEAGEVGDNELQPQGFCTGLDQSGEGVLAACLVLRMEDDGGAVVDQPLCCRVADAVGAAGEEHGSVNKG